MLDRVLMVSRYRAGNSPPVSECNVSENILSPPSYASQINRPRPHLRAWERGSGKSEMCTGDKPNKTATCVITVFIEFLSGRVENLAILHNQNTANSAPCCPLPHSHTEPLAADVRGRPRCIALAGTQGHASRHRDAAVLRSPPGGETDPEPTS